jgi:enoyl-CoA hydratase/3-hydroxyacyl-CoA dehydrogenase
MVDIDNIQTMTVIGAGVQGHAITQVALMAGFNKVTLYDVNAEQIKKAVQLIENGSPISATEDEDLNYGLKVMESRGCLSQGLTSDLLLKRLVLESDLRNAVSGADFIIEAVPEVLETKQEVFKELGELSPLRAILASNTSTISITRIAEKCKKQDKVMGMHFFAPINSRLIEITKGKNTSNETMDIGEAVANKFPCTEGRRMVARLEKESPGFIANRLNIIMVLYLNWVLEQAVEQEIPYEQIDADVSGIMVRGPFELFDFIGIDTVVNAMKYFESAVSKDFAPGNLLTKLVEEGNLGLKTGRGFYDWSKEAPKIDKSIKSGLFNPEIALALQLNEGCRMLEEGIVKGYKIIDDVNLAGYGNPGPFIPGKKKYETWSKLLDEFADKSGKEYARPCDLMRSGEFITMRK